MANGNEPSGAGLVVLTGLSIAAVVGLYAADVIPRRSGPALSHDVAWPRWQSSPSYDRSYDAAPAPQVVQGQAAPTSAPQGSPSTGERYQRNPEQGYQPQQQPQAPQQQAYPNQQPYPNQQGYPQQQQPAQDDYPQDVPTEGGPPTQQQYTQPSQPNGQPY